MLIEEERESQGRGEARMSPVRAMEGDFVGEDG